MGADESGRALLYGDGFIDRDPSWSPDSHTIAFESKQPFSNSDYDIYTVAVDSSGARGQLTSNTFDDISPAWQPVIP